MKTLYAILLTFIFTVAGCSGDKVNLSDLKPAASKSDGSTKKSPAASPTKAAG